MEKNQETIHSAHSARTALDHGGLDEGEGADFAQAKCDLYATTYIVEVTRIVMQVHGTAKSGEDSASTVSSLVV